MKNCENDILRNSIKQVDEVIAINKDLTEKTLRMHCLSYFSQVKAKLLTQTIFEVEISKKCLQKANSELINNNQKLKHHQDLIDSQNEELERQNIQLEEARNELEQRVKDRTADLEEANKRLQLEIEERAHTEVELKESEEKFRSISACANDAIIMVDDEGEILYWNNAAEILFKYTKEDAIGKALHDLIIPVNIRENYSKSYKDFLKTGRESYIGKMAELMAVKKDNTELPIERSVSRVMIKDKWNAIEMIRDVSSRKKLEERLKRAEKMEALGLLAGGVAHDINNILTPISGYPDLILMDLPENSPLRDDVIDIKRSGEKAAAVVQDLLALARRGHSVLKVVNLNDIINEYVKSPEYMALAKTFRNIEFEFSLETDLMNIKSSHIRLSKVVMNLILNASEAMPSGGKVNISTKNQYIDRPISGYDEVEEGDYAVLAVSDNGIGIPSEDLKRIFEPFYTKKEMGRSGTGLGLAVVWGIVKDCKGYIEVKSAKDEYTSFYLYFPVSRDEFLEEKSSIPIDELLGNRERILVVDDISEQRNIASAILSRLRYSVTMASSGEEAIKFMADDSADLIVLDMIMEGGMDGLDTYRNILKFHPGQKAVIASGYAETDRARETIRLGAGEYVMKPYTLEKIGLAVKSQLAKP